MPKIAHFIDSHDSGGAESIVIELCRKSGDYGYEPEIYHFGNLWLEEKCRENDIPAFIVPGHRFYTSSLTIPLFAVMFFRFLKRRRVDVLHSHLFGPIIGACFAAFLAGIPHIGTLHDIYTLEEKKIRIRYLQVSSLLGTKLVTVSHQMKTFLRNQGRFHNGSIQTIVNGVEVEKYHAPADRLQYPDLGLGRDDIVFICVGRLEQIKGHDVLLQAFKQLMPQRNVKLLIVGEGPCRTEIEKQIVGSGLPDNVRMLGHRSDVPALLNLCDCFVLASRSEGLSCSIIEAMAAGLPVIATDVGGNRELVKDNVNGYLVPPGNADAMGHMMRDLLESESKRTMYGATSRQRAREQYSLKTMLRQYVDIYDSTTPGGGI
jgi:glycosyltransferase involved in cell wall biosynthesis